MRRKQEKNIWLCNLVNNAQTKFEWSVKYPVTKEKGNI
jgi:hypothetical protein